jgi:hypothetical protein
MTPFVLVDTKPIRTWVSDGEEVFALGPVLCAVREELRAEGLNGPGTEATRARLEEYRRHEREMSEELIRRIIEVDAEQRANGYTGALALIEDDSGGLN